MKYSEDLKIPKKILKKMNHRSVEVFIRDTERCEEDMYAENIIIPASLLFDIDFAIIKLIQEVYNKISFWDDTINYSDKEIHDLLFNRENENPLTILKNNLDDSTLQTLDGLYTSIIKEDFVRLMAISAVFPTGLYELIKRVAKQDRTKVTIYCDVINHHTITDESFAKQQAAMIKSVLNKDDDSIKVTYVTEPLRSMEAYREFTVIFYKFVSQLNKDLSYPTTTGYAWSQKTILCSNYTMNLEPGMPEQTLKLDTVLETSISNKIGLTSVFVDKDLH